MRSMPTQKTRFHLIDGLRGFAVINMVAFHFLYDLFIICGKNPLWYGLPAVQFWQQAICRLFLLISGFVWPWGMGSHVRRGILLNLCGLAISAVTWIVLPEQAIWFGVLNFIGCAVLLLIPIHRAVKQLPSLLCGVCAGLCLVLFLLCGPIPQGCFGIGSFQVQLPAFFYSVKILTPLGFPFPGFRSSDYFPVLPWIFLYLCGYFCGRLLMEYPAFRRAMRRKIPVLSPVGQKSLLIYLIHQPVCMLACFLLFSPH